MDADPGVADWFLPGGTDADRPRIDLEQNPTLWHFGARIESGAHLVVVHVFSCWFLLVYLSFFL